MAANGRVMTWTKLGSEFFDECANEDLSDAAVRTHAEAISWVYGVESTDLCFQRNLIRRFAGSAQWESAVTELLAKGWWAADGATYCLVHHADVIRASIAAQQIKRDRDKKAQRAHRQRSGAQRVSADVSACVIADADSQTDSLEGVRGDLGENQGRTPPNGKVDRPSPGPPVSAYVSADTLLCDACGAAGTTVEEPGGWRVCVGRCVQEPS